MGYALYRFDRSGDRPDFVVISDADTEEVLSEYVDESTTLAEVVQVSVDLGSFPCDRPLNHGM